MLTQFKVLICALKCGQWIRFHTSSSNTFKPVTTISVKSPQIPKSMSSSGEWEKEGGRERSFLQSTISISESSLLFNLLLSETDPASPHNQYSSGTPQPLCHAMSNLCNNVVPELHAGLESRSDWCCVNLEFLYSIPQLKICIPNALWITLSAWAATFKNLQACIPVPAAPKYVNPRLTSAPKIHHLTGLNYICHFTAHFTNISTTCSLRWPFHTDNSTNLCAISEFTDPACCMQIQVIHIFYKW